MTNSLGSSEELWSLERAVRVRQAIDSLEPITGFALLVAWPVSWFVLVAVFSPVRTIDEPWSNSDVFLGIASIVAMIVIWAGMALLLQFALRSLRPGLAALILLVLAGPALGGILFALSLPPPPEAKLENFIAGRLNPFFVIVASLALTLAIPLLSAWRKYAGLTMRERAWVRTAMPMSTPAQILSEMFGVWPGVRRPLVTRAIAFAISLVVNVLLFVLHVGLVVVAVGSLFMGCVFAFAAVQEPSRAGMPEGGALATFFALALGFGIAAAGAALCATIAIVGLRLASLADSVARYVSRQGFDQQARHDRRPPILFLRSFQNDQVAIRDRFLYRMLRRSSSRLDHLLVEQFSRFGPIAAIGRPGEKRLPFGAARLYVSDEQWQDVVGDLMRRSRAIVIVADVGPGVAWELAMAMGPEFQHKTIVLAPPAEAMSSLQAVAGNALSRPALAAQTIGLLFREGVWVNLTAHRKSLASYTTALRAFFCNV